MYRREFLFMLTKFLSLSPFVKFLPVPKEPSNTWYQEGHEPQVEMATKHVDSGFIYGKGHVWIDGVDAGELMSGTIKLDVRDGPQEYRDAWIGGVFDVLPPFAMQTIILTGRIADDCEWSICECGDLTSDKNVV